MEKSKSVFRNIFLILSVVSFLVVTQGCNQLSNDKTGTEKAGKVTITVDGDDNVTNGKGTSFKVDKGAKWKTVKARSEIANVTFKSNYTLSQWKLGNGSGNALTDDYAFNDNAAVFAVSKVIDSSVTISIDGDGNVTNGKGTSFKVDKGAKWKIVKTRSEIQSVTFADGFELSEWKLGNGSGNALTDDYAFNDNATVFAVSKVMTPKITISIDGDDNVTNGKGTSFKVDQGAKWETVKTRSEVENVTVKDGLNLYEWRLDSKQGNELDDGYVFNGNAKIFAVSGKYKKVPYAELDPYLDDNASSEKVNYIEVTKIPDGKLKGKMVYPFEAGGLGQILNFHGDKKVGLRFPNGITVTDMSACFANCKTIVSVENIPNGVTNMQFCFDGCENLETAPDIPSSVVNVHGCFRSCKSLTQASVIPSGVTDLTSCFSYCENLATAPAIPDGVVSVRYCFVDCKKLVAPPTIPTSVKNMDGCFSGCEKLASVPNIPDGVTTMMECFKNCKALTAPPATIPASVTNLKRCFYGCETLATAPTLNNGLDDMTACFSGCEALVVAPAIPDTVTTLELCFSECTALTTPPTSIPASVKDISGCFAQCEALETVPTLSEGVSDMSSCFKDCAAITQGPKIPSTVKDMSEAFINCAALATAPEIPQSAAVTDMTLCFSGCEELEIAPVIPSSVTTLEDCFNGCTKLTTVTSKIPETVVNMESCFSGCAKLTGVTLDCAYVVDKFNGAFEECSAISDGMIKVKETHLQTYQDNAGKMGTTREKFDKQST